MKFTNSPSASTQVGKVFEEIGGCFIKYSIKCLGSIFTQFTLEDEPQKPTLCCLISARCILNVKPTENEVMIINIKLCNW